MNICFKLEFHFVVTHLSEPHTRHRFPFPLNKIEPVLFHEILYPLEIEKIEPERRILPKDKKLAESRGNLPLISTRKLDA